MRAGVGRQALRMALLAGLGLSLAGCQSLGVGNPFAGLWTAPADEAPPTIVSGAADPDEFCPVVDIFEGGAALRLGGMESSSVRHQLTVNQTARQCTANPGGGYTLRVGVQGLALLGPAGRPGRFDAPVRVRVTRGDTVIFDRTQQVSVTIPAGETQAQFVHVEQGIVVPPSPEDAKIEVGLGNAPATRRRR
jgi:hypothetical protein